MKKITAIYARLSVCHQNRKDESIENQIRLAKQWLSTQPPVTTRYYIDQGYSGTTFLRPAFQQLLADCRKGSVVCIVCKDSSRLGRDYIRTGEYMEKIFPAWGIRLVCIADAYDSADGQPGSLQICMKNLVNEWYAKDIGRKVRLTKQQQKKQGAYLGSKAPYGWKICRINGIRCLCEDPETIGIVQEILAWDAAGDSLSVIRDRLNERKIAVPTRYRQTGQCIETEHIYEKWDRGTLRYLIEHQRGLLHG